MAGEGEDATGALEEEGPGKGGERQRTQGKGEDATAAATATATTTKSTTHLTRRRGRRIFCCTAIVRTRLIAKRSPLRLVCVTRAVSGLMLTLAARVRQGRSFSGSLDEMRVADRKAVAIWISSNSRAGVVLA